jgi:hypothetical protein
MNDGKKRSVPPWVWVLVLVPLAALSLGVLVKLGQRTYRNFVNAKAAQARAAESPPSQPANAPPAAAGEALDLSSIMGRAHHLANAWEPEAALLGIEANILSGRIQPSEGGSAKLTFGPSHLSAAPRHSGLFVVSYDKDGIHGAPATGKLGPELPEPMCAPEAVLLRVPEFGHAPILLRYGLDSVQRPSWLVSPVSDPKQLRIFEPQACAPRGTIVVRPRL